MKILVTGANGFIGRNLVTCLERSGQHEVTGIDTGNTAEELGEALATTNFVFHLAGVNRPETEAEFRTGNVDFTAHICERLLALGRPVSLLLSSSTQAELDNPYGRSKRQAEEVVKAYAEESGARAIVYRLTNVFGKWCRPNYNSVVATFCHSIARDLPITISNPDHVMDLVHVDDVCAASLQSWQQTGRRPVIAKQNPPTGSRWRRGRSNPCLPQHAPVAAHPRLCRSLHP